MIGRTTLQRRMASLRVIAALLLLFTSSTVGAPNPDALDRLLEDVGRQVQVFCDQFTAVTCSEQVVQRRLNASDKVQLERQARYDYLLVFGLEGDELTVEESRLQQGKPPKSTSTPLLLTSGFSTLLLVFHPHFQNDYEFSLEAPAAAPQSSEVTIHFRQKPSARVLSVLQLKGREYPIVWRGKAWVDPSSGRISRIQAGLDTPMADLGLIHLDTEVSYGPIHFSELKETYWLPQMATIDAETPRRHWQNRHRFSGYRRFSVTTQEETGGVP
ncbi:MAG: hypothetical protein AB1898_13440 [Acidobacteriota bacterium]